MSCPSDGNTGLIVLNGPISATDLKHTSNGKHGDGIRVNSYPLTIAFAPQTTVPPKPSNNDNKLAMNNIEMNTCTYKSDKYVLMDVQFVRVTHNGFKLPEQTAEPSAELILSYSSTSSASDATGILLCVPIYQSSQPYRDSYLSQLDEQKADNAQVATLESIFAEKSEVATQTSLAYKTCFDTMTGNQMKKHSLYVIVFPRGVSIHTTRYQSLLGGMTLPKYHMHSTIRGGDSTVSAYSFDANGNRRSETTSSNGELPFTTISTCTAAFRNRIEYFTKSPNIVSTTSSGRTSIGSAGPNCGKTKEYKCMPFDMLRDSNGDYVSFNANAPTLTDTALKEKCKQLRNEDLNVDTDAFDWEGVLIDVGVYSAIGLIVIGIGAVMMKD
jgi:hypothetical protein